MFVQTILYGLGTFFALCFLFLLGLLLYEILFLRDIRKSVLRYNKTRDRKSLTFFSHLLDDLETAQEQGNEALSANLQSHIWIEFDKLVAAPYTAISTYCNAIIMIGFVGTLWGAINAFRKMGVLINGDKNIADAFAAVMQGSISLALYSSLVAAGLVAVINVVFSAHQEKCIREIESAVNREIGAILKRFPVAARQQAPQEG